MRHVFVETNWVFAYAAPAHHKRLDAVDLLKRAAHGEILIHLPAPCLTEARPAILRKCQPRNEADAIRQFLLRARGENKISTEHERATREVLDHFEQQIRRELAQLDQVLRRIRTEPGIDVFPLNERMFERTVSLAEMDIPLKPFDQAILGAILGRSDELRVDHDNELCFCVTDADLQTWDKRGNAKQPLTQVYDDAHIWVYGDFGLNNPERPEKWPM